MAEVLRSAHSPSRGTMDGPTTTQQYIDKDKNTNHQYPPSKTQGMGLERWLVTTHNNSQQKLSQPCSPPRAKVGRLSISVVAERALANILG